MTRLKASFAAALLALLSVAPWASLGAAEPAAQDGLVPVRDRNLDRLLVRPGADLASYRKVMLDSVEVAWRPGPGVLRLTPKLRDFYVNAPSKTAPGVQPYTVYAGEATLELEARDGASGELLAKVVDRRTTDLRRVVPTSGPSNRFGFETMFSRWAANCAKAFQATRKPA